MQELDLALCVPQWYRREVKGGSTGLIVRPDSFRINQRPTIHYLPKEVHVIIKESPPALIVSFFSATRVIFNKSSVYNQLIYLISAASIIRRFNKKENLTNGTILEGLRLIS